MSNIKFQNAISHKAQKCPPIWMMRQAGRYHKHYQKLKEKYDFMTLCKNPELACEVAMGPIEDFDFDVAILFSDLLFPLEALGMGLVYDPGPKLDRALTPNDLVNLKSLDQAEDFLRFQHEAVRLTRQRLPKDKSLVGFVGGPWTLFTYATSGAHDGNLIQPKTQMPFYIQFCEVMIELLRRNIKLQLDAGADVVMIFDTAAGELSPQMYNDFVAPGLSSLAKAFPNKLGYYSKWTQASHLQSQIFSDQNWAGFGVDHRWSMSELLPKRDWGFTQGNFDQALLFLDEVNFKRELLKWLEPLQKLSLEERAGWVCGLGHGVLPKTPENNVRAFVQTVREVLN